MILFQIKSLKSQNRKKKTFDNAVSRPNDKNESKSIHTSKSYSTRESSIIKENELSPSIGVSANFDDVVSKWQSLIDLVQQERSLLLGDIFSNLQLIGLNGQELKISASSHDIESDFALHRDYIDKKIQQVFGKKLNLKVTVPMVDPQTEKTSKKVKKTSNDPLEKLIIEELGAEEIS